MQTNQTQKNIPKDWVEKKLGDFSNITTGNRDANHGSINGQYPFFTCAQKISRIDDYNFDTEAILVAGNGDFNVKYYKGKFDAYQRTYVIDSFRGVDSIFLYQKMQSILNNLVRNNQGSSVKFIKKGDLTEYNLILPPLREQQKIAEILGEVDKEIEKTDEIIKKTEKLKKGLLVSLMNKGETTKIKEVSEINPEQVNPKLHKEIEFNYIDIASVKDFKVFQFNKFYGKDAPSRARRVTHKDDILISCVRPNLKSFTYINDDYKNLLSSTGFCLLRSNENKIKSRYLYYEILKDKFVNYLVSKTTGSNYPAVNPSQIGDYEFKLPPMNDQQKIAEILSAVDEKISVNKKLKEKLTQLKKGLMQDLLSGEVRVDY